MITTKAVKKPISTGGAMRSTTRLAAALTFAIASVGRGQDAPARPPISGLRLPRIFSNGMVVQRGQPIAVWGWSAPHSAVVVRLASRSARTQADAQGAWSAQLPALGAGGPFQLVVR